MLVQNVEATNLSCSKTSMRCKLGPLIQYTKSKAATQSCNEVVKLALILDHCGPPYLYQHYQPCYWHKDAKGRILAMASNIQESIQLHDPAIAFSQLRDAEKLPEWHPLQTIMGLQTHVRSKKFVKQFWPTGNNGISYHIGLVCENFWYSLEGEQQTIITLLCTFKKH